MKQILLVNNLECVITNYILNYSHNYEGKLPKNVLEYTENVNGILNTSL